ncbi:hypothetical protein Pelo_7782 [Pelomyxa schiedti]|nr:hypothetical protein Pelo_7782 [Pelomyxa schiedti]
MEWWFIVIFLLTRCPDPREVMDFYDAVELLKSTAHLFNSESPDADLSTSPAWCGTSDSWKEMVMDIYTHFVCEDSPQQINIPGTVLMEITSQVNSNNFPVDIYDSAQEEMKKMMQSDSFQQFLVTPTLKVLLSTQPLIVDTEPEISDTTIVPVCPKCLTEVTAGSKTCIVKDSLWHAGCISCIHCDTPLPADDYTQKFPRCSTCDGFNYKVSALQANNKRVLQDLTPSCLACDQLIEDENYIVRRIGEKLEERFFWHNECFICSACGPSGSQLALPYPFDHAIQIKFCLSEMSMFCKEHLSGSVTPFLTPKKIRPEIFQMRPALCTPTLPVQLIPEMMPQISRSQRPCLSEIVLYNNCIHPEPPPRTPPPKPTLTPCVICPPMLTQKDTPVPVCSCILGEATCPCGPMDHLSKKTEPEKPMDLQRLRSFSVISTRVTPTAVQCLRQTRRAIASSTRPPLGTPTPPVLLELSIIILTQSPVRPCLSSPALPECLQVLKPQFPQTRSPRPPLDPPTSPSEISPVAPPCIHTRCRKPQLSCPTAPCHSLLGPPSDQVVDALSENPPAEGPPKISSEQVPPPESTVLQGEFKPPVLCEEGSPGFDHISPPINDKDFSSGETIPIDAQLEVIQQLQQQQNELQKQRKRRSSLLNHLSDEQLKQEAVAQFHELRKQQEERQRLHHQLLKENRTRNRALKQQERMQSYLMELLTVMENSPESFTESLPDADLSLPETDLPLPAETELSPDMEYTSPIESPRELQSYDQMLQTALSLNPPPLPKTDTTPYEEQGTRNDSPPPCPSPVPPSLTPESAFIPPPPFPEDLCMACNTAITPATPHKLIPGRNMKVHSDCIVCHTCGSNTPSSFGITQGRFYCPGTQIALYVRRQYQGDPLLLILMVDTVTLSACVAPCARCLLEIKRLHLPD